MRPLAIPASGKERKLAVQISQGRIGFVRVVVDIALSS
jgi:hypothetical protein